MIFGKYLALINYYHCHNHHPLNLIFHFQLGFGFCKGDDNFGGGRRKELDDFTLSLGKQMNLVLLVMILLMVIMLIVIMIIMITMLVDFTLSLGKHMNLIMWVKKMIMN